MLPTASDINVFDSLDEQTALQNFLGLDHDQALERFQDNWYHFHEDLMHMGPVAFCYYVQDAYRYFEHDDWDGDDVDITMLLSVLELRLDHDRAAIRAAIPRTLQALRSMDLNWARFERAGANSDTHQRLLRCLEMAQNGDA
jgi:hypothetical protein